MGESDDTGAALFAVEPDWLDGGTSGEPVSAGRRRTLRQAAAIAVGRHPLTRGRLHPEAAPAEPRDAPGRRCGNCRFRELVAHRSRTYPKCWYGWSGRAGEAPPRYTHGEASDVRAWWPGCVDHQPQKSPTDVIDDLSGGG